MFRNIITLLIATCISLQLSAQEILLKEGHPDRHVVVKGDTLWDISAKFLKTPWAWPKVWNLNRDEIKNPHLIYPGDVIVLDMSSGSPQLKLLAESTSRPTVNIDPNIVIESLKKEAIPTISLNKVAPFLNQPLVIENNQLSSAPRIIAGQDDRVVLSPDTRIYVRGIPDNANLNWQIYRQGDALTDPDTNALLGYEATYLGDARVTKYGDPATAMITKAKEEIFIKDRLMPLRDDLDTHFLPRAPDTVIQGRIMNIYGGVQEAGKGSIVSINRGSADSLAPGHVLTIKSYGRVVKDAEVPKKEANNIIKLPDERAGLLMIFRVYNHVSYGLVMETNQAVNQYDTVVTPSSSQDN